MVLERKSLFRGNTHQGRSWRKLSFATIFSGGLENDEINCSYLGCVFSEQYKWNGDKISYVLLKCLYCTYDVAYSKNAKSTISPLTLGKCLLKHGYSWCLTCLLITNWTVSVLFTDNLLAFVSYFLLYPNRYIFLLDFDHVPILFT
jgi:hypothetical protein